MTDSPAVVDAARHYLRVAELLEASNRYLERARTAETENARLARSRDHLRRQAVKRGDFATCEGCEGYLCAGDFYCDDANGVLCVECAPTYQALIDDPGGFIKLENEEPRTPEDLRALFDTHIAAGGKPTDSLATWVIE